MTPRGRRKPQLISISEPCALIEGRAPPLLQFKTGVAAMEPAGHCAGRGRTVSALKVAPSSSMVPTNRALKPCVCVPVEEHVEQDPRFRARAIANSRAGPERVKARQ